LLNSGFDVSGSHCEPNAVKTNAPNRIVWKILQKWVFWPTNVPY
jgi:tRNA G26 N,N-dimethylase Trm1